MNKIGGSFRDPSGHVCIEGGKVFRTINDCYKDHWQVAEPFLKRLVSKGLMASFTEASPLKGAWKTLCLQEIPFISYPYEWSFSQRKAAALLTLRLQRSALAHGLVLKDATAYNIQFIGANPIFIDHLSFEKLEPGKPWDAYGQFCSHFLAPLALEALTDIECGLLSRLWIDGIPLHLAIKMLPLQARFRFGLFLHLYLHAKSQHKYADAGTHAGKAKKVSISLQALENIAASLEKTVQALALPKLKTEWGDYYEDTNYSDEAAQNKYDLIETLVQRPEEKGMALDIGANTGRYSRLLAGHYACVLAADIDPLAVDRHYNALQGQPQNNTLPLVFNFANPSPALGSNESERASFSQRVKADCILALALVHHLTITAGIPLREQAKYFANLLAAGGTLILEFVPKSDSQVKRLLALRKDIFQDYTLEGCLQAFHMFECIEKIPVADSARVILLLKKNVDGI